MLELRAGRRCYSEAVEGVNVGLAFVDALIGFVALYKVIKLFFFWVLFSIVNWSSE